MTELSTQRISVFDRDFRFQHHILLTGVHLFPQLFDICILQNPTELLVADGRNGAIQVFFPETGWLKAVTDLQPE